MRRLTIRIGTVTANSITTSIQMATFTIGLQGTFRRARRLRGGPTWLCTRPGWQRRRPGGMKTLPWLRRTLFRSRRLGI
eukprot:1061304-Alexandrium_andersonii.AAC.1